MARTKNHPKISEFKQRDLPITYSNLSVNFDGQLEERKMSIKDRVAKGYGLIWGSRNDYGEKFVKGAFRKSITENGPGSDASYQIKFRDRHGKSVSLFAKLIEDDIGLYFETKPLDKVQWADDLLVQLESGTINNFSVGFKHMWDRVEWDDEDDSLVILEARLFEISAVDIPSDTLTYACRSAEDNENLLEEVEEFISKLAKVYQLQARTIFARCMTPIVEDKPLEERKALDSDTPQKIVAGDYSFLLNELKN